MDLSQIQKVVLLEHLLGGVAILVKNYDIHDSNAPSVDGRLTPAHTRNLRDVRVDIVLQLDERILVRRGSHVTFYFIAF